MNRECIATNNAIFAFHEASKVIGSRVRMCRVELVRRSAVNGG